MFTFLLFLVYFAPTIVAIFKEHPKSATIFLMNLSLAWLLIPWVFLLIWAWSDGKDPN